MQWKRHAQWRRPYTAIKIVHHQFKINKRKDDGKSGNRSSEVRERERMRTGEYTVKQFWTAGRKLYTPSHFVLLFIIIWLKWTAQHSTAQSNRNDPSMAEWAVQAIIWIAYILSSSNEANEAQMKASNNHNATRIDTERMKRRWKRRRRRKNDDDNNKENVF